MPDFALIFYILLQAFMNYIKSLFVIALPIILQNFLSSLVNMLDTIMVGQLGAVDVAAVGLGNQVFFVMNIIMFGVCSGGTIFITQFWGKEDMDGVHRSMGITFGATFIIAFFFTLSALFFPEFCISLYTDDGLVIKKGADYLRFVCPSYIFIGFNIAAGSAMRSTKWGNLPMIATGISVVVNCLFNYIFIFVFKMGIVGAAIATVISRVIEFLISLLVPYIKHYSIAVSPVKYFNHQPGFFPRYLRICLPVLINESLWGIGISMQSSIYGHAGTSVVAAYNITSTISNLVWTFFIGCGNAAAIIIGQKIGKALYDEAIKLAKKLTVFMTGSACILGLLLIPLAFSLNLFFNLEPEVIKMTRVFLLITVVFYPMYAINMITVVGICRSGGDTVYALITDVGFMWIISIPLGFAAVKLWHLPYWGIFLCVSSENIFKSIMGLARLKDGKWLHDVTLS